MSETTATSEAAPEASASAPPAPPASPGTPHPAENDATAPGGLGEALKRQALNVHALLEAGVHFGHQPSRWNPLMRSYIFGERNGTHIIDLDQTLPMMREALDFLRETTAAGGSVLFVSTKRQAQGPIMTEASRARQHYVNRRWLGGMLTNWKTVKKSIDRYNQMLEILGDEEKKAELSKKELAAITRQCDKYSKSLDGMRKMERLPSAVFIVDVGKESIAVEEAKRLNIPIVAVIDTNCSPRDIDFVIPGNDDAIRAIDLYCTAVADACLEGDARHQAELVERRTSAPAEAPAEAGPRTGRRVVEIKQPPRRGRGGSGAAGGGKAYSAGGRRGGGDVPAAGASDAASGTGAPEGESKG